MWCKWVAAKEGRCCKDVAVHQNSAKDDDHDHAAATIAAAQQQQQQQQQPGREGGKQAGKQAGWLPVLGRLFYFLYLFSFFGEGFNFVM
jgi:hypothetical protein